MVGQRANDFLNRSWLILTLSLLVAVGAWASEVGIEQWSEMLQPGPFFSVAGVVAGTLLAWLGKSPRKI
jgi:hypothetical protein